LSNHERAYRVRCHAGVALGTQLLSLDLRIPVCSLLVAWAWTGSPGSVQGDPMRCDAIVRAVVLSATAWPWAGIMP